MGADKNMWEMYLRQNYISQKDTREFVGEVKSKGVTLHNEDIADIIVAKGSELRKETIVSVLNQRDTEVSEWLCSGGSFADGIVQMSPRVSGVWESAKDTFDATRHKKTLDLVLTSAFKSALEKVQVLVLGEKNAVASIARITDTATGKTDGTVTIGDEEQGVFVVDSSGAEHRVSRRLSVNKPTQVMARVPSDVSAGKVKIVVKTRYSGNKETALKTLRVITYSVECSAVEGA